MYKWLLMAVVVLVAQAVLAVAPTPTPHPSANASKFSQLAEDDLSVDAPVPTDGSFVDPSRHRCAVYTKNEALWMHCTGSAACIVSFGTPGPTPTP